MTVRGLLPGFPLGAAADRLLRVVGTGLAAAVVLVGWFAPAAHGDPWVTPVPPDVAHRFDPPDQPWLPGHRGVDLLADAGTVVRAAGAGRVSVAGPVAGRGVVVVVHGDLRTTYEPVTALVAVGDTVAPGQPIGVLAPTAGHCPGRPCLHWGLLRGSTYLDPMALLGPPRVRLLPFSAQGTAPLPAASRPAAAPGGAPQTRPGGPGGQAVGLPPRGRPTAVAGVAAGATLVVAATTVAVAARRRAPPR